MRRASLDVVAGVIALVGLIVVAVVAVHDARAALHAWIFGFATTLALVLGALALLMIGITAHASWPLVVRKPLEALVATLPLQVVLFLPIAIFARRVFPWAMSPSPLDAEALEKVEMKRAWLNVPAFEARAAICFAVWIAIAFLMLRASRRQDAREPGATSQLRTIAAFDWLMSLEPAWFSNQYGMYVFVGAFSSAVALAALVFARERSEGGLPSRVGPSHSHALGNVLLAAVILWAYVGFAQLIIYWIADLPEEIVWYQKRVSHGWAAIATALFFIHFAVPFAALLFRDLKRAPRALAVVAGVVLLGHALDFLWLVTPALHPRLFVPIAEIASLAACASLTLLAQRFVARRRAQVPRGDPLFEASLRYEMR